ncbi:MAG: MFS transporter, partial [Chloroflexota bacterium]
THSLMQFFAIGALAGFAMAGVQSLSRTFVGAISPKRQSAEFFGFFEVVGRTSSFIGPAVYGVLAAESALVYEGRGLAALAAEQAGQRVAILSIAAFLLVGMLLLLLVNEKRALQTAREANGAPV